MQLFLPPPNGIRFASSRPCLIAFWFLLLIASTLSAQSPTELTANFAHTNGTFRSLHGINKGPLAAGGLIDLTTPLRELGVPSARLHDCHWPNPDVVDVHVLFPDFAADPEQSSNYDFALTDEYLAATKLTGAEIMYRLGESIEHTSKKRFVHPPKDPAKWAAICLGIIRHYNLGWANGYHHEIKYWEIWNEPENRPAMWSGSDEEYYRLYAATAVAIKARYPHLKVGGPAVGASGQFIKGNSVPTAFVTNFLALCRRMSLPLDFFSWHCYTADPSELVARARTIRTLLDKNGFLKTESHLNEWNFLPGNSWKPLARSSPPESRQRYYEDMAGTPGAIFILTALLELQDAPVTGCNLFHGELGGFGLFNEHGVPQKNYHSLRAFRQLLTTPQRVETRGGSPGRLSLAAGLNTEHSEASFLVSNFAQAQTDFRLISANLPWSGPSIVEIRRIDSDHDFETVLTQTNRSTEEPVTLRLQQPAAAFIRLRPALPNRETPPK